MAGTLLPQEGLQGLWAQFQMLGQRITNLEVWQRQATGSTTGLARPELEQRVRELTDRVAALEAARAAPEK